MADLPDWAESWSKARCECGARCVNVACYCGGHIVCSASGWDADVCLSHNAPPEAPVEAGHKDGNRDTPSATAETQVP